MMIIAWLLSFLLNPFFVLMSAPYVLLNKISSDYVYVMKWILVSYMFLSLVMLFVIGGVLFGIFSDFDISKKEERPLLFWFSGFVTFLYVVTLFALQAPKVLFIATFALLSGVIIVGVVNKWLKASVHVAVISAFLFLVGIVHGGAYLLLLILIPLAAWSRIKTKRHTLLEATVGGVLGSAITVIVYVVSKHFLV